MSRSVSRSAACSPSPLRLTSWVWTGQSKRIADSVTATLHPNLHAWLHSQWPTLNCSGAHSWSTVRTGYASLRAAALEVDACWSVANVGKQIKRYEREMQGQPPELIEGSSTTASDSTLTEARLQGAHNNLVGA